MMPPPLLSWARFGVLPTFDPQYKFVTSPLLSSSALGALRALLAVYALVTTCTFLAFEASTFHTGKSFLSFFTNLSYIGLTAYYWAAAVQTLVYARWGSYPLRRWPRILQALHVLLQSTITTFPFIVTVVFWALLASSSTLSTTYGAWSNISMHAMNSLFALIDILLTNTPPAPWLTLPIHIVFLGGYLGVAYITHATQGFYTYSFLDPATQHALLAAYIVGIAVGEVVVFLIARSVVVLRQRAAVRAGKLAPSDGEGEEIHASEGLEEWEEVERPTAERKRGGEDEGRRVIDSGVAEAEAETV